PGRAGTTASGTTRSSSPSAGIGRWPSSDRTRRIGSATGAGRSGRCGSCSSTLECCCGAARATELKGARPAAEESSVGRDTRDARALPLEAFLSGRPPAYVLLVAIAFVIGVGVADHALGPTISLAPFYVLPILIATWNLGRAWGFLVAGLAAIAMQLADVRAFETDVLVPSWNALVWYAVFLFVVWLLAIIRDYF